MKSFLEISVGLLLAATAASAQTLVVVETDVLSQNVNVQGTVYVSQNKAVQTVAATTTVAPVSVTTYKTTYTQAPVSSVVNKGATINVAATNANTQTTVSTHIATSATQSAQPQSTSQSTSQASNQQSSSSQGLNTFQQQILNEHNVKRALHKGVGSLTWSNTLAQYAEKYANAYSCPSNGALTHSGGQYGENLASGYSTIGTVDAWYDEIKQYSYSAPGFTEATGHFTQLIWKSSTQVGCAYMDCSGKNNYGTYIVCEYYPRGNIVVSGDTSYWSSNVPPLK